jgi:hypothetical protein
MKKLLAIVLLSGAAAAQDPAKPAPRADELEATIVDVVGSVDVKRPDDKDWVAAEKNMKLKKGSEICTAASSTATLLFPPNLTIEVKAITLAKLDDLAKSGTKIKTDMKLKFGSVNIDLKKSDIETGLKVATPNSTTSVSGSTGTISAWAQRDPRSLTLIVNTGRWQHTDNSTGGDQNFGPGDKTNDRNDLSNDLDFMWTSDQYSNFFGRDDGELYTDPFSVKGHDVTTGLNPTYEGGSSLNPFYDAFNQAGLLPAPPPPP